jgi:hypothetical protein
MRVCPAKDPIETQPDPDRRVLCWLHGPETEIPDGWTAPAERARIAVAEEA